MSKTKARHTFTLILSGVSEVTAELEDALFEAGCDDALLGSRDGVVFLDFSREASSFQEGVLSAIADVQSIGASIQRIEPDELVSMSEIARRTGRTRESIRLLATGLRGPGFFPPPVANLRQRSPIWRWTDAASWFQIKLGHSFEGGLQLETSDFIAAVNGMLEARRHSVNIRDYYEKAHRLVFAQKPRKTKANARGRKVPDKIEA
jgi:hypothetical protein